MPLRMLVVAPADNQGDVKLAMQKQLGGVNTPKPVFTGPVECIGWSS